MLRKKPAKRPTAATLLEHPWLTAKEDLLRASTLDTGKLREWNAKRKFKGAAKAVMAINAFKAAQV